MGGAIVFLPSVFTACNDSNGDVTGVGGTPAQFTLNLSNDTGILNYAYALEQLEAAYYTAALGSAGFAARASCASGPWSPTRFGPLRHWPPSQPRL